MRFCASLPEQPLRTLSAKLLADLKAAHERLDQNPSNSSRPPSSRDPWQSEEGGETPNQPLRHWVIARRISYGTRNPQGSRAFTLLAGVIETCRQRGHSPWSSIAETLRERRRGNPVPVLPAAIG